MRKKGFTLVEMLIVIFVLSTGIILIIKGMSGSHRYLSETAQRTVALNLAKEGIEAVYNLRNSNWRKWSDKKNECWLSVWEECWEYSWELTNSQMRIFWLQKGDICVYDHQKWGHFPNETNNTDSFSPQWWNVTSWQRDDKNWRWEDNGDNPKNNDQFKLIYFKGKWIPLWMISGHERGFYLNSPKGNPSCWAEYLDATKNNLWEYSRVITIQGLFDKTTGQKLTCTDTASTPCKSSSPKELRFCSTVFYTKPYQGVVNVCSIMTNFEQ